MHRRAKLFARLPLGTNKNNCLPLSLCCDGTDVRGRDVVPMTLLLLALPDYLRNAFSAIFFGGSLPVGVKAQGIFLMLIPPFACHAVLSSAAAS